MRFLVFSNVVQTNVHLISQLMFFCLMLQFCAICNYVFYEKLKSKKLVILLKYIAKITLKAANMKFCGTFFMKGP